MAYDMDRLVLVAFNFFLDLAVAVYVAGPYMIPVAIIYLYLGYRLQRYGISLTREISRLYAISASPIAQKFSEGLQGCKSIRAYGVQSQIMDKFKETLDDHQKNKIVISGVMYGLCEFSVYLSLLAMVPSIIMAVLVNKSSGGNISILLKYLISIGFNIRMAISIISNQENRFVSFERCQFFMNIPPEDGYVSQQLSIESYTEMMEEGLIEKEARVEIHSE